MFAMPTTVQEGDQSCAYTTALKTNKMRRSAAVEVHQVCGLHRPMLLNIHSDERADPLQLARKILEPSRHARRGSASAVSPHCIHSYGGRERSIRRSPGCGSRIYLTTISRSFEKLASTPMDTIIRIVGQHTSSLRPCGARSRRHEYAHTSGGTHR